MSQPIYKFWKIKPTEAWYRLSDEEKQEKIALIEGSKEKVGHKAIFMASCSWSTDKWSFFGIDEYPDINAVQEFTNHLKKLDLFRYIESSAILGTKIPLN